MTPSTPSMTRAGQLWVPGLAPHVALARLDPAAARVAHSTRVTLMLTHRSGRKHGRVHVEPVADPGSRGFPVSDLRVVEGVEVEVEVVVEVGEEGDARVGRERHGTLVDTALRPVRSF
jgi:hypothetical protein